MCVLLLCQLTTKDIVKMAPTGLNKGALEELLRNLKNAIFLKGQEKHFVEDRETPLLWWAIEIILLLNWVGPSVTVLVRFPGCISTQTQSHTCTKYGGQEDRGRNNSMDYLNTWVMSTCCCKGVPAFQLLSKTLTSSKSVTVLRILKMKGPAHSLNCSGKQK